MTQPTPTDRPTLTGAQLAQLRVLDGAPDTAATPEAPEAHWQDARRFHRPRKEAISLRLDADVLDWLRHGGERYQTRINRILRERMQAERLTTRSRLTPAPRPA